MFKYADYIYKVYEEKSFTLAAKKLFVSQPALSAIIKKAEEELGFKLFNRETTPVGLTDLGQVYIAAVEEMYRVKQNLKDGINSITALLTGEIKASGAAFISSFILPKIIMEFSARYPKIDIQLIESNSLELQEKLFSEQVEVLIDYDFDGDKFVSYPLKKEHILLAVPRQHRINEQLADMALTAEDVILNKHLDPDVQCVDLSLFKEEGFIQLKQKNNMYKCSHNICGAYGFAPHSLIDVDQLLTAYNIAGSGMGLTFTTDIVVQSAARYENLLFYKLNSSHAERILYIAHKKKKHISPAVNEFIKIAKEIYAGDAMTNNVGQK